MADEVLVRIRSEETEDASLRLRDPILEKQREYLRLASELDAEKRAFAQRTRHLARRVEQLEEELREEAKSRGVTEFDLIRFAPRVQRFIDTAKFAEFLMSLGKRELLFDLAEVPVGKACSAFGEGTLEGAGVLQRKIDPYARCAPKD